MSKTPDNDESGLMESLSGVRKLEFDRVDLHQQKPKPPPRLQPAQRPSNRAEPGGVLATHGPARDSWFDSGVSPKLQRRIKAGKLEIEAMIDLHGLRQQQALAELNRFVQEAIILHHRLLLVIHGQGYRSAESAKLRPLVQRWLLDQSMVLGFCHAQPRHGGNGASYVFLRAQK